MTDTLAGICRTKREHVARRKAALPEAALRRRTDSLPPREAGRFEEALRADKARRGFGLIAEIKKASPSKGVIRADFDPASLAGQYEAAGAGCMSVLTDTPYFQGEDRFLEDVRAAVQAPLLRKDFMLEPYQIAESFLLGADCVLLILAALSDGEARRLADEAEKFDMSVLVEVHDEEEMRRALSLPSVSMIGINNRSLKDLSVSLAVTERLAPTVPDGVIAVCESGVKTPQDVKRMCDAGAEAFLIGESFMRYPDVEAGVRTFLDEAEALVKGG
jgi:indole-3-glycerol phosphate synthase